MMFPNWFRVLWWALLLAGLTALVALRAEALISGTGTYLDGLFVMIGVALWLVPLGSEVQVGFLRLRRELEKARRELATQLLDIRSEIQSTVAVRSEISPHFNFPIVSDERLPGVGEEIRAATRRAGAQNVDDDVKILNEIEVDSQDALLFRVRYALDKEIRRIFAGAFEENSIREHTSAIALSRMLSNVDAIDTDLAKGVRELYRVCTPAVHGEGATEAQVAFVRSAAPGVLMALRRIA